MAAAYPLAGGPVPGETTTWLGDDKYVYSTNNSVPSGNRCTNGGSPVLVTHLRGFVAGRGATRTVRLGLTGGWTGWFNVGASSSAQDTGWIGYGGVLNGGAYNFHIDQSAGGGMYFGRSVNGTGSTGVEGGGGGWSGSLSGQMLVVGSPSQVRSVTATRNSNGTITVTWAAPSDDGGDAISVYYINSATNSSFTANASQVTTGPSARSYTFSGLIPGVTYYFRMSSGNSLNAAYGHGSAWSSTASAQSSGVPGTPGVPVVSKVAATDTSVKLTWTAPANNGSAITFYDVHRSTTENFSAGTVTTQTSTTNTTTFPVTLGVKYYWRVKPNNSIGSGPWSAITSYPIAPSAPSSVGVASINSTSLTASWNAPSNLGGDPINNYQLNWSTSSTFATGSTSTGNNRSRAVTGLTALTVYYFRVRAQNGVSYGPWSAISSFTTSQTEPPPPPPAVSRGGRLKIAGTFLEPKVRVKDDNGVWQEPLSKVRVDHVWVDPS